MVDLGSTDAVSTEEDPFSRFLLREELTVLTTTPKKNLTEEITIWVKCVFPVPEHPGEMGQITRSLRCKASEKVEETVKRALENMPDVPQSPGKKYYLGFDQLLFREGTLTECGITHNKTVELYAPGKNAAVYHNEGLTFVLWALIPILLGITCFVFAVMSNSERPEANNFKALFLFLGMLLLIPSASVLILGLILIPECPMPCYFGGTEWW
jgi:hypothetical protein